MSISGYRSRIMYGLNFGDHLVFLGNESIFCMNKFGKLGKQLNTTHFYLRRTCRYFWSS
jgi:hypothetical protein